MKVILGMFLIAALFPVIGLAIPVAGAVLLALFAYNVVRGPKW